jgi:hypothetical protein
MTHKHGVYGSDTHRYKPDHKACKERPESKVIGADTKSEGDRGFRIHRNGSPSGAVTQVTVMNGDDTTKHNR